MAMDGLGALGKRGLSLLRVGTDQWKAIEGKFHGGARFSLTFPHEIAHAGKRRSLALIVTAGDRVGLRIGLIRSIQAVSTFDSRVVFDFVRPIRPQSLEHLLARVDESALRAAVKKIRANAGQQFRHVSPKLGERLVDIVANDSQNATVLQRMASEVSRPKRFENARAMQQDAVGLALKAFGLSGAGATTISLPGDSTLGTTRLHEDAVIEHDARWIPGWELEDSDLTGRAIFTRRDAKLEVFTANKRPLEELFGVDLIYFNELRGSIVMVQYKMMEPEIRKRRHVETDIFDYEIVEEQEWTVPINAQFQDELKRMELFDKDLSPSGPYRLNAGAFFFKLVRRHAATNTSGIMLSLGHLNQLITEGDASGPRGGLRLSYKSLNGHYLRSDPFVDLIQSGYVGTRGATTEHFRHLIEAALTGGRAVVAAIQSASEPRSPKPASLDADPEMTSTAE